MRIILLLLILVQPWLVLGQEGVLLYVGSTEDSGWQIFELRLSSGAVSQLSFSMGDKREPQHSAAAKLTTCRNSLGQVLKLNDGKEQVLITNIQHCANYALVPDGTAFYFTKPGEGIRRQDIWIQPRLAASVPEGMLKQVSVSADGQWLTATHIWRANEERLVIFPTTNAGAPEYATAEKSLDAFPHWAADSKSVLFSEQNARRNYELKQYSLENKTVTTLLSSIRVNNCNPVTDKSGEFVFFERRSLEGSFIACLDRKNGDVRKLPIPRQAREPFWYE